MNHPKVLAKLSRHLARRGIMHWGVRAWNALHRGCLLSDFEKMLPQCGPCRDMYDEYKADNPPESDPPSFEWTWDLHDTVNEKLGKAVRPTLEEARGIHGRPD